MSSLRRKTISGVIWSASSKLILQLVLLGVTALLARLLSKDDFGVVGMAAIITVAVNMVNDKGLGTAIVQRKYLDSNHLSSLFWGSIAFGVFLYLLSAVIAVPMAQFFRKPVVSPVVLVMALGFVIGSFGIVQKSLMTREMDFKRLSILEIFSVLPAGLAAVIMAKAGFGVWSLVANSVLRDLFNVAGLWIVHPWRPRRHFSWKEFREYIGFSSKVLANDGAIYLITNTDVTIIGRVLGSAALGVYNLALYLVKLPVTRISAIVARVVFPAFSSLQDEPDKFGKAYLRATKYISLIAFPLLAILAVFSREIVLLVLGEKWIEMILPLIIMTPMGMLKSVGTIRDSVFMAVGKPQIELYWNIGYFFPLAAAVYLGTRWGVVGAASAFTLASIAAFPFIQHLTNKAAGISMKRFIGSISTAAIATAVAAAAGWGALYAGRHLHLPLIARVTLGSIWMTGIYLLILHSLEPEFLPEAKQILKEKDIKPVEYSFYDEVAS
ncbi:MAG: MOP flippase family protein [candidate division KSB1 bacterium]|nr:MOP flippase family protein [candidate division KSB1 bacterium]